jgi:hypothetical protein
MKVDRYADDESSEVEEYHDQRVLESAGNSSYNKVIGKEDDDESVTETSVMSQSNQKQTKVGRIACCCITLLAVGAVAVGSSFLAMHLIGGKAMSPQSSSSSASKAPEETLCQPQLSDIRESLLELHINAGRFNHTIDKKEANLLGNAVTEGYNAATGGCLDEFERFMAGSILKNETLIENLSDMDENDITVEFDAAKTLILEFETVISCDGCNDDEAFASNFPSTYGPSSGRRALRHLASEPLDAGKIMEEIEKRIKYVLPDLGHITDAIVQTKSDGGAAASKERTTSLVSKTKGPTREPILMRL